MAWVRAAETGCWLSVTRPHGRLAAAVDSAPADETRRRPQLPLRPFVALLSEELMGDDTPYMYAYTRWFATPLQERLRPLRRLQAQQWEVRQLCEQLAQSAGKCFDFFLKLPLRALPRYSLLLKELVKDAEGGQGSQQQQHEEEEEEEELEEEGAVEAARQLIAALAAKQRTMSGMCEAVRAVRGAVPCSCAVTIVRGLGLGLAAAAAASSSDGAAASRGDGKAAGFIKAAVFGVTRGGSGEGGVQAAPYSHRHPLVVQARVLAAAPANEGREIKSGKFTTRGAHRRDGGGQGPGQESDASSSGEGDPYWGERHQLRLGHGALSSCRLVLKVLDGQGGPCLGRAELWLAQALPCGR
eukprot:COSAG01_NODE_1029_length_12019_cov_560.144631_3_plen_356_part_00